jgi:hypothetical protein
MQDQGNSSDQIGSHSLCFIMKLCNFLLCFVSLENGNAIHCGTEAEAKILLKIQSLFVIYNSSSSEASEAVRTRVIRECGRHSLDVCCWDEGHLVQRMVDLTSRKKKLAKKAKPSSPSLPSIQSMATAVTTKLPVIAFNCVPKGRRSAPNFESSCLFVGSRIDGRLIVRFMHGLDVSNALSSFTDFVSAEESESIFDDPEPYFAGFFLHESQFSGELFESLKQLYCKIAPVFVHLSQARSGRRSAEWWCCSEDSSPIKFVLQTHGWIVHVDGAEATSCQSGFDVFFKRGSDSVTVVDPKTLKEVRMSRRSELFIDARKRDDKVPFCNKLLKDFGFQARFPSLWTEDLVLVDQNVVWSFIDVGARQFVHVVALLSRSDYAQLIQKQKYSYLHALTWIFSRTGAAPANIYMISGNVFAVRTACCFMLNQMTKIGNDDVPSVLKQWYAKKDAPLEVPETKLLTSLIETYRSARIINTTRQAHEFPVGRAQMMFSQMYDETSFYQLRSSLHILPTLEFHQNSCWMETAVNALFAIPLARVKLFSELSIQDSVVKCLRSLFDIMCVYGPSDFNRVPFLECQRCGVYPIVGDTAPPVLGQKGYSDIFASSERSWGVLGCAFSTLLRFCTSLQLSVSEVFYDPVNMDSDYQTVIQSGMNDDVVLVSVDKEKKICPSKIVEVISNGFCGAVLFGNGAHHYSMCKAMKGETWTVKDNLVNAYETFPTFADALAGAFTVHAVSDEYFVHTLVYYQDEMDDSDV